MVLGMSNELVQKMIALKAIEFEDGTIRILGRNVVFMPVDVILKLQKDLEEAVGPEKAREMLYGLGLYQTTTGCVKYLASNEELRGMFPRAPNTGNPAMEMGREVLKFSGWGDHKIVEMKDGGKKFVIKTLVSPFAKEYLKSRGKAGAPVCHYICGLLAGVSGGAHGKKYHCTETSCMATGLTESCTFELVQE